MEGKKSEIKGSWGTVLIWTVHFFSLSHIIIPIHSPALQKMWQMQEHFAPFFPGNRVEIKLATAHTIAVKGSSVLSKELFTSCDTRNKLISTIYFINFKSLA